MLHHRIIPSVCPELVQFSLHVGLHLLPPGSNFIHIRLQLISVLLLWIINSFSVNVH